MRPKHSFLLILLTAALSYGAAVTTYTSQTAWINAGPVNVGLIDFSGIPQGQVSSPLLISGFSFASSGINNMYMLNPAQPYTTLGSGPTLTSPASPEGFVITPPAGVYGIGFLVGLWGGGSNNLVVTINGTQVYLDTNNNPITAAFSLDNNPTFIGFRSDTAITSLTLAAATTGNRVNIDNVQWGAQGAPPPPPEAPEGSTILLIGTGLLALPALRRRFKIQTSSPHNTLAL